MTDIANMIALVQIMIHHEKGVEVQIKPPTSNREMSLLLRAYQIASQWSVAVNLKNG
jgi:hypothetical protein